MGKILKLEQWLWSLYDKAIDKIFGRKFSTPEEEIEFYESRREFGLARFVAGLHGYHDKAQELYSRELEKLADGGHNEEAGRLAEAEGYLRTALEYYKKAGWQPAVQRLEETIKNEEDRKEFYRRAGLSD